MGVKKRFSKDPKVKLISIDDFYKDTNYLYDMPMVELWSDKTIPEPFGYYYKFTSKYLIIIVYGGYLANFGTKMKSNLDTVYVAIRDGKTEYELLDKKIAELEKEKTNHKKSKKTEQHINRIIETKKLIPKYIKQKEVANRPFESYLVDSGYKTENKELKNKYIVFDVETNGIRTSKDDLLSLSIYDPTTGMCYNRFFPLDLQPMVFTSFIHGINEKTLAKFTHMTQQELDWLYDYFNLRERTLLSYSGGLGTFDSDFIKNYCKRHWLNGFDDLKYENIKNKLPKAPYGTEGQLTKDNMCRIFGIEGVKRNHSSYNDCILEWKLFEKLESEHVIFINEHLYKYTPEYIIPYSYLSWHSDLVKYAEIKIPRILGKATELYKFEFPQNLIKKIKKFPTNITGITIEHGINAYLEAEEQDNIAFLAQNKSHLKYIGSLDKNIKEIPIIKEYDGTVKSVCQEDEEYIKQVNNVTKKIIEQIKPVADYIKNNIFEDGRIMTQELSISPDRKVLALCDLSNKKNVVEIKTYDVIGKNNIIREPLARQLYYQANGRKPYVLSIVFTTHKGEKNFEEIVDDLKIYLYEVELREFKDSEMVYVKTLSENELKVFKQIIANPLITKTELSKKTHYSLKGVNNIIDALSLFGYIKKEKHNDRHEPWKILRDLKDKKTNYIIENEIIHVVSKQLDNKEN